MCCHRPTQTTFASNARLQAGVLDGALYVKGSGDPKLTSESLQVIVAALRTAVSATSAATPDH